MSRSCAWCGSPSATLKFCLPCHHARADIERKLRVPALAAVKRAIRLGNLAPAYTHQCADCGGDAQFYDHRHYSQPLQVDPVCISCNNLRGRAVDLREAYDALRESRATA